MSGHIVQLLLGLFLLANGALVYMKALTLFQAEDSNPMAWIGLSIGAIFVIGFAWLLYAFGVTVATHLVALLA